MLKSTSKTQCIPKSSFRGAL